MNLARNFVAGDAARQQCPKRIRVDWGRHLAHNQRSNTLPPHLIRHAKHKRFFNGPASQCRFNFRWIHILAASHNQITAALHEKEVAILIEIAKVAGE